MKKIAALILALGISFVAQVDAYTVSFVNYSPFEIQGTVVLRGAGGNKFISVGPSSGKERTNEVIGQIDTGIDCINSITLVPKASQSAIALREALIATGKSVSEIKVPQSIQIANPFQPSPVDFTKLFIGCYNLTITIEYIESENQLQAGFIKGGGFMQVDGGMRTIVSK